MKKILLIFCLIPSVFAMHHSRGNIDSIQPTQSTQGLVRNQRSSIDIPNQGQGTSTQRSSSITPSSVTPIWLRDSVSTGMGVNPVLEGSSIIRSSPDNSVQLPPTRPNTPQLTFPREIIEIFESLKNENLSIDDETKNTIFEKIKLIFTLEISEDKSFDENKTVVEILAFTFNEILIKFLLSKTNEKTRIIQVEFLEKINNSIQKRIKEKLSTNHSLFAEIFESKFEISNIMRNNFINGLKIIEKQTEIESKLKKIQLYNSITCVICCSAALLLLIKTLKN